MSSLHSGTTKTFVITVSSRALFDLEESNRVFEEQGMEAYAAYQKAREHEPLKPGPAMHMVRKLLEINKNLPPDVLPFEVILLSRNSSETAMRVFHTIDAMKLPIIRCVFTNGAPTSTYIKALETKLFLSSNPVQVAKAIEAGIAAATVMNPTDQAENDGEQAPSEQLRIALDGDSVLFGDESERAHYEGGLAAFQQHEEERAHIPLSDGPFRAFLEAIHAVQKAFPESEGPCPIRTALVTARAMTAHKRAVATLQHWGIRVDEMMFLGGRDKGPFLEAFRADLFFDDSKQNINSALRRRIASGHVPFGVRNAPDADDSRGTGGHTPAATPPEGPGTCSPEGASTESSRKRPRP